MNNVLKMWRVLWEQFNLEVVLFQNLILSLNL